jgi:hypothetical protein
MAGAVDDGVANMADGGAGGAPPITRTKEK